MFATLATARPVALRPAALAAMGFRRVPRGTFEVWIDRGGTPRYYVHHNKVWNFLDVVADA